METTALSFARPALLNALWLLPLVIVLYWWAERKRRALVSRIVAPKLREFLVGNASAGRRIFRQTCVLLAFALLVVTLAGPRVGYDTLEVPHRGRDVIIAMDVSRSMLAPDIAPSRLERAKMLAEDIIGELGSDRVGLVAFAGSAFLQAPLTLDYGAVLAALEELDTTVIPKGGTNIAAAIKEAKEAFGKAEGFSRALIIISDGEELDADGVAAAKRAGEAGIRIFTVGVGSKEGSEIPLGNGDFVRDASGKVVQTRLDEARMAEIAEATGGFYTPLDNAAARRLIVDGINKLAESDITMNSSRRPIERYQWPLGSALLLLVLQALVGERRRRPVGVMAAILLGGLCFIPAHLDAAPAGIKAYEDGDYKTAKDLFEKRLKQEPSSPDLNLNVGAADYKLGDYTKAAEQFSKAMLAEGSEINSKAEFNLANTLFMQGVKLEDKTKKKDVWKDAIAKYEAALKNHPNFKEAKENKEYVEKALEELEKEQEQQDQKQDQNQNQKQNQDQDQQQDQNQQQNKDQQKDQENKGGESGEDKKQEKDKEGQSGQDKKDEQDREDKNKEGDKGKEDQQKEDKGDDKKEGGDKGEEEKPDDKGRPEDQQQEPGRDSGDKPQQVPDQPSEKKEGELQGTEPDEGGEQQAEEMQAAEEEERDGEMSPSQARALLRAMQNEEEQVNLRQRKNYQEVYKDW